MSEHGFRYDSSAVPPEILSGGYTADHPGSDRDDYGDRNGIFTSHVKKLWGYEEQQESFLANGKIRKYNPEPAIDRYAQPFRMEQLWEIPDNCALTDFCSPDRTVFPLVEQYLEDLGDGDERDKVIVYGCHLEGEVAYKIQLARFFQKIEELNCDWISFCTMRDLIPGSST